MMNGVLPQREGASREEPPRVELREAAPTGEGHDRNLGEVQAMEQFGANPWCCRSSSGGKPIEQHGLRVVADTTVVASKTP